MDGLQTSAVPPHALPATSQAPSAIAQTLQRPAQPQAAGHSEFAALAAALSGEHPIAYSVNVARITGDVKAALFLSQLIYWTRVGVDVEEHSGWIFKSREQWTAETGLSRYEQESVRIKLLCQGLIEEARVGNPARNCYRVVPQALGTALARLLRSEPVQWTLFDIRSNAQQFKALLGRNLAFYRLFAEITPTVTSAVFLTKALSVQRSVSIAQAERQANQAGKPAQQNNDWFCLSTAQWQTETGLTTSQQRECKQKLCQLEYISEAFQSYPRRRTYIQVSLSKVSAAIRGHVLAKVANGTAKHGILGVLAKGLQQQARQQNSPAGQSRQTVPSSPAGQNLHTSPVGQTVQILHTSPVGQTVQILHTSPVGQTVQILHTSPVGQSSQILAACENPPSSNSHSASLDGDFSHTSRLDLAHQMVEKPVIQRRVLAALHARPADLTTSKTTTTITKPLACEKPPLNPDGEFSHPVVVVVPEKSPNTGNEDHSPAAILASVTRWMAWPKELDAQARTLCSRLLIASGIDQNRHQVLVDELAGNLNQPGKVRNALSYFAYLLRLEASTPGGIIPVTGHLVAASRNVKPEEKPFWQKQESPPPRALLPNGKVELSATAIVQRELLAKLRAQIVIGKSVANPHSLPATPKSHN